MHGPKIQLFVKTNLPSKVFPQEVHGGLEQQKCSFKWQALSIPLLKSWKLALAPNIGSIFGPRITFSKVQSTLFESLRELVPKACFTHLGFRHVYFLKRTMYNI
jgi:hypothetical protein